MSLTPKQLEILDFVVAFIDEHRYAPTLRETGEEFDISRVTVLQHLNELEEKGYIERESNVSRGIKVLKTPTHSGSGGGEERNEVPASGENTSGAGSGEAFPMLGYIAAGKPIEAIEHPEELSLSQLVGKDSDCYLLRVKGNSMVGDNIQEGDFVLVKKEKEPREGQMVVALLEHGEATLKRYYRENGEIILEPSNPEHEPIRTEEGNVEIQGIVLGLVRNYG